VILPFHDSDQIPRNIFRHALIPHGSWFELILSLWQDLYALLTAASQATSPDVESISVLQVYILKS